MVDKGPSLSKPRTSSQLQPVFENTTICDIPPVKTSNARSEKLLLIVTLDKSILTANERINLINFGEDLHLRV